MVSIGSYTANNAVLTSLRKLNQDIATNQTRIGTGKKINSAMDNASVWATATSLKADINSHEALSSNMALAKGKADSANAALTKVGDLLNQMKVVSNEFTNNGAKTADEAAASSKIKSLQDQITATIKGAAFQGTNLLKTTTALDVTISTEKDTAAAINLSLTTKDLTDAAAKTDLAVKGAVATGGNITSIAGLVDTALTEINGYQGTVATFANGLASQIDFMATLKSIRQSALDEMVNADLSEESAKATALQVQQQLAYQALSMGNSSSQNILRLFQ